MKAPPAGLEVEAVVEALADGWDFDVTGAEYAPVGAGSYHWFVNDRTGRRAFVTVDDLALRSWLGDSPDAAFEALAVAFDTAVALRGAGLDFVVAPLLTEAGESLRRIGPRHSVALFPFVDGRAREWGESVPGESAAVVPMLAELHRATPTVQSWARTAGLELPGRTHLESALADLGRPWSDGPYAERSREALAARAQDVRELLALADQLAATVALRGDPWVITHGEPHVANVLEVGDRRVLVDWDTVALAPAERDLWIVLTETDDELAAAYASATGHRVDHDALKFFRLTWGLKDLVENLNALRSPHEDTADTARAFDGLTYCVSIRDQWASLLD